MKIIYLSKYRNLDQCNVNYNSNSVIFLKALVQYIFMVLQHNVIKPYSDDVLLIWYVLL